jgi:pilus assembly protein Flp/PilA
MFEYLKTWMELKTDRRAVTMLEYAIMAALIAGVCVVGVGLIGTNAETMFNTIAGKITNPA